MLLLMMKSFGVSKGHSQRGSSGSPPLILSSAFYATDFEPQELRSPIHNTSISLPFVSVLVVECTRKICGAGAWWVPLGREYLMKGPQFENFGYVSK